MCYTQNRKSLSIWNFYTFIIRPQLINVLFLWIEEKRENGEAKGEKSA